MNLPEPGRAPHMGSSPQPQHGTAASSAGGHRGRWHTRRTRTAGWWPCWSQWPPCCRPWLAARCGAPAPACRSPCRWSRPWRGPPEVPPDPTRRRPGLQPGRHGRTSPESDRHGQNNSVSTKLGWACKMGQRYDGADTSRMKSRFSGCVGRSNLWMLLETSTVKLVKQKRKLQAV